MVAAPDAAAVDEAADEEVDDVVDGELLRTTRRRVKEYNGWRVSYCKFDTHEAIRGKFKRYLVKCAESVGAGGAASRHKAADAKEEARGLTKSKVATATAARRTHFKQKRAAL